MKIPTEVIAQYYCNHQPLSVRRRVLKNERFRERFNIGIRSILTIGGQFQVEERELFTVVRQVLKTRLEGRLRGVKGEEFSIKLDYDQIYLVSSSGIQIGILNTLFILSPDRNERTSAIKTVIKQLGPTAPDFKNLLHNAKTQMLTDDDASMIFLESVTGAVALQARASNALKMDETTIEDLIPCSLQYYEHYCGPKPEDNDPEEYIQKILPKYRKKLLNHDLESGLNICLHGALRDDLLPGIWTQHLSNDEMWDVLQKCNPQRDPYSLLGATDIALGRLEDERYKSLAEGAIIKLTKEIFPRPDGIDTYEMMSLFADLALHRINTLENSISYPP